MQAVLTCIELYKSSQLPSTTELSEMIAVLGTVGLRKYHYVRLEKKGEKFMFVSKFKDNEMKDHN